jgi:uncharacterized protein
MFAAGTVSVVFDTVIFVRSLLNPRSIWGQLVFAHFGEYRLFVSRPTVLEMLEVLHRPALTARFRSLQGRDLSTILGIMADAEVVEVTDIPPICRDPGDDKFLATAAAAHADYLVSEDQDLLVLGEHEGTKIVRCAEFLEMLSRRDG